MPSIEVFGDGPRTVPCSSLALGYVYSQISTVVQFPGLRVNQNSTWINPAEIFVNSGGQWRPVDATYIVENGQWKSSAPTLEIGSTKNQISLRPCSLSYAGDHGGISYMEFFMPGGYYVPAGWIFKRFSWGGVYDKNLDGLYLTQSQALADAMGNTGGKRKALILAKSRSPVYTGRTTYTGEGSVSTPGPTQPSVFEWLQPTWARTDLISPGDHDENAVSERVYSVGVQPVGNCNADANYNYPVSLPTDYILPFPVDRIVSARYSPECGSCRRECNHSSCPNIYFDFEQPTPPPPPA